MDMDLKVCHTHLKLIRALEGVMLALTLLIRHQGKFTCFSNTGDAFSCNSLVAVLNGDVKLVNKVS